MFIDAIWCDSIGGKTKGGGTNKKASQLDQSFFYFIRSHYNFDCLACLCCAFFFLTEHMPSIEHLSILGKGPILCCSPLILTVGFLWELFLVCCEGIRTHQTNVSFLYWAILVTCYWLITKTPYKLSDNRIESVCEKIRTKWAKWNPSGLVNMDKERDWEDKLDGEVEGALDLCSLCQG